MCVFVYLTEIQAMATELSAVACRLIPTCKCSAAAVGRWLPEDIVYNAATSRFLSKLSPSPMFVPLRLSYGKA
jgi:hypothetical protein